MNLWKNFKKTAFTLGELLVSIAISAIVLVAVFFFINSMSTEVVLIEKQKNIVTEFLDFRRELDSYRKKYTEVSIWNPTSIGAKFFAMENKTWTDWYIFWAVNLGNESNFLKLNEDISTYKNTVLWFRRLSESEITKIKRWEKNYADLAFQKDKIYNNLKVRNIKIEAYNSGTTSQKIYDMEFEINKDFKESFIWQKWEDLAKDTLSTLTYDF